MSEWSQRDRFVLSWNKEAMYSLGATWFLDINSRGQVHYLTALDRFRYALRLKQSRFLPKPISRRWPLLKFGLHNGCTTPFTLKYSYSYAHSWPSAQQLGVSAKLAARLRSGLRNTMLSAMWNELKIQLLRAVGSIVKVRSRDLEFSL